MPARIRRKSQLSIAREGFLDRRSKRCFWLLLSPQTKVARAGARNSPCAGCGRDEGVLRRCAAAPHPSRLRRATCLPAGRSVRGSDRPPACHSTPRTPQGEGFFRPGALLLALFISFWQCRSGPSGTGATGRRRGLRRGRRSWENPWHRRSWCRWWAGSSNSRRRREPSPTWP